jgi:hypothetical protein
MPRGHYRVNLPILALRGEESHYARVTIPAASVIHVEMQVVSSDGVLDVVWEGQHFLMLPRDLREYAEFLDTRKSA